MTKPPKSKEYWTQYKEENGDRIRSNRRVWERHLREEVIRHYGGKCTCRGCTETHMEFLTIWGRNEERGDSKSPLLYWLKRNNYPEGFQVLCHNCNMSRGRYGYCPHEIKTISRPLP